MTPEQLLEQASLAYVGTVAVAAGAQWYRTAVDDGAIDLVLHWKEASNGVPNVRLDVQVKARRDLKWRGDWLLFSLDDRTRKILDAPAQVPHVLVVISMPDGEPVSWTPRGLSFVECVGYYWDPRSSIDAMPDRSRTRTIEIPRADQFSPDAARRLRDRAAEETLNCTRLRGPGALPELIEALERMLEERAWTPNRAVGDAQVYTDPLGSRQLLVPPRDVANAAFYADAAIAVLAEGDPRAKASLRDTLRARSRSVAATGEAAPMARVQIENVADALREDGCLKVSHLGTGGQGTAFLVQKPSRDPGRRVAHSVVKVPRLQAAVAGDRLGTTTRPDVAREQLEHEGDWIIGNRALPGVGGHAEVKELRGRDLVCPALWISLDAVDTDTSHPIALHAVMPPRGLCHDEGVADWTHVARRLVETALAMHSRGFSHWDIKPENVVVRVREGRWIDPRLIDFGAASRHGEWGGQFTSTYLFPEFLEIVRLEPLIRAAGHDAWRRVRPLLDPQVRVLPGLVADVHAIACLLAQVALGARWRERTEASLRPPALPPVPSFLPEGTAPSAPDLQALHGSLTVKRPDRPSSRYFELTRAAEAGRRGREVLDAGFEASVPARQRAPLRLCRALFDHAQAAWQGELDLVAALHGWLCRLSSVESAAREPPSRLRDVQPFRPLAQSIDTLSRLWGPRDAVVEDCRRYVAAGTSGPEPGDFSSRVDAAVDVARSGRGRAALDLLERALDDHADAVRTGALVDKGALVRALRLYLGALCRRERRFEAAQATISAWTGLVRDGANDPWLSLLAQGVIVNSRPDPSQARSAAQTCLAVPRHGEDRERIRFEAWRNLAFGMAVAEGALADAADEARLRLADTIRHPGSQADTALAWLLFARLVEGSGAEGLAKRFRALHGAADVAVFVGLPHEYAEVLFRAAEYLAAVDGLPDDADPVGTWSAAARCASRAATLSLVLESGAPVVPRDCLPRSLECLELAARAWFRVLDTLLGDPTWRQDPPDERAAASGFRLDDESVLQALRATSLWRNTARLMARRAEGAESAFAAVSRLRTVSAAGRGSPADREDIGSVWAERLYDDWGLEIADLWETGGDLAIELVERGRPRAGAAEEQLRAMAGPWLPQSGEGRRMLDVGSGTGGTARRFAELGWRAVGVDPSGWCVNAAQDRPAPRGDVTFKRLGVTELTAAITPGGLFAPEGFDLVIARDSLCHVTDKAGAVTAIHRLLAPGGVFLATDWVQVEPCGTREYLDLLERMRFTDLLTRQGWRALLRGRFQFRTELRSADMRRFLEGRRGRAEERLREPGLSVAEGRTRAAVSAYVGRLTDFIRPEQASQPTAPEPVGFPLGWCFLAARKVT